MPFQTFFSRLKSTFPSLTARSKIACSSHRIASDPRRLSVSGATTIRLFILSTFSDMDAEREVLRSQVFPIVRRTCEQRGIGFFEVDLRWGVTQNEVESGQVLPICLDEIDRCRPYLLGLIGGWYGTIDPKAGARLQEHGFAGLIAHAGRSLTELELRYALLQRPPDCDPTSALLYRRPGAPAAEEHEGVEAPTSFGPLLHELAAAGIAFHETPDSLEGFAVQVRDDLLQLADAIQLPRAPDPVEQAREAARRTARVIAHRFVERQAKSDLERLVGRRAQRIAIVGEAGCGKTMLVSALVDRASGMRIVSAIRPAAWADADEALRTVVRQIVLEGPDQTRGSAREAFQAALTAAAELGPILDGIVDRNLSGNEVPAWLPGRVAGATIIVTLRAAGTSVEALRRAGWRVVAVGELSREEIAAMTERYLAPFGRRLDPLHLEALRRHPRTTLEVSILLEELRAVPRNKVLKEAVARLGRCTNLEALLDIVVERLRAEHGAAADAVLAALALAPDGLPETTLKVLAGEPGRPLADLRFALLRRALDGLTTGDALEPVLRSSILAEAISRRFHPGRVAKVRKKIADRLRMSPQTPGAAEECLRQLVLLGDWIAVERLLHDPEVFDPMARRSGQLLRAYWAKLLRKRPQVSLSIYAAWVGDAPVPRVAAAAQLVLDLGDEVLAWRLAEDGCARAGADEPHAFAACASMLAGLAEERGSLDEALDRLAVLDRDDIRAAVPHASAVAALSRARIAILRSDPREGCAALDRAAGMVAQTGDQRLAAVVQETRGVLALRAPDLREAGRLFDELLAIGDRLGDLSIIAAAESGRAKLARLRGKAREAKRTAARAERFARIAGDQRILEDVLGIVTKIAIEDLDIDRAYAVAQERLKLNRGVVGKLEIEVDLARIYAHLGDVSRAEQTIEGVRSKAVAIGVASLVAALPSPDKLSN